MKTRGRGSGAQRRRFVLALCALLPASALARVWPRADAERIEATLAAYVDTLLPQDALSPSASQLDLHRRIVREFSTLPFQRRLLDVGCAWLDQAAEEPFRSAPPRVRDVVVEWMSQAESDRVPRRFYEVVRQRALELYYSQSEAWGGLPLTRPPQPLGHPEPWR